MREQINEFIGEAKTDGTIERLTQKWLGKTEPLSYKVAWWKKVIRIVLGVVIAVALKEVIKRGNVFGVMSAII